MGTTKRVALEAAAARCTFIPECANKAAKPICSYHLNAIVSDVCNETEDLRAGIRQVIGDYCDILGPAMGALVDLHDGKPPRDKDRERFARRHREGWIDNGASLKGWKTRRARSEKNATTEKKV